ncbi:MAG: lysophospholipid acyltransferase family protein [Gemmataceae bacterium]
MMKRLLSEWWYSFNFAINYMIYTFGFGLKTRGVDNMPQTGPVLIIANHESFLDPVGVGLAVRRRINYLARKTLFKSKLFGSYLYSVGCVPVDQDGVAKEGLRQSIDIIKAGKPMLIFPEGERAWDGKMKPFKPGLLLILRKAPVTIVPVGVAGAHESYPRGASFPRLAPLFFPPNGASMACSVGKPIPPEKYAGMEREQLLRFLFRAVHDEVDKAEKLRLKPR